MTLIDKLIALTGPDFNVDKEIYKALFADEYAARVEKLKSGPMGPRLTVYDYDGYIAVPAYTASIDAAMTLVPEGWTVAHITQNDDKSWFAELREGFLTSYNRVATSPINTATPAIALCIAALKARDLT